MRVEYVTVTGAVIDVEADLVSLVIFRKKVANPEESQVNIIDSYHARANGGPLRELSEDTYARLSPQLHKASK